MGDHFSRPYDANFLSPENRFFVIVWVGGDFSRPYDANFGSPKIDFWVGDQFSRPDDANFRRHVFLTVPAVRFF